MYRNVLSRAVRNDNSCFRFGRIVPLWTPLQTSYNIRGYPMTETWGGLTGSIDLQYCIMPTGHGLWPPQKRVSPHLTLTSSPQVELRKWFFAYFWSDKWYALHSIPHTGCLLTYEKRKSKSKRTEASKINPREFHFYYPRSVLFNGDGKG
jgi:hypothetical protein